jgi:hypothetical protein
MVEGTRKLLTKYRCSVTVSVLPIAYVELSRKPQHQQKECTEQKMDIF